MQKQLTRRIAGEIVVSEKPGETLRKWREIFHLSQKEFANLLEGFEHVPQPDHSEPEKSNTNLILLDGDKQ